jgi:uncharacterized membrane protein (DUF106 family)
MLDFLFRPLMNLIGPFWTVVFLSLVLGLLTTIAHKYMTDQKLMRNARDEMKKLQTKMRSHKDNPKKLLEVQNKMMSYNMDIMKQSFRPLLVTFIPVIIIFGWISAATVYVPIMPDEGFTTTVTVVGDGSVLAMSETLAVLTPTVATSENVAVFGFSGPEGEHTITYEYNGAKVTQEILIGERYANPKVSVKAPFKKIEANLEHLNMLNLGFTQFTGFGTYIVFTILFSLLLRKLLNVA